MSMNLYTTAGGLLGTHVTWDDIEEDMQRELGTVATFGPNKTAKNVGDGRGFMSRIALIEPDWQHKDKQLPERFIVKIVSQLAMLQLTEDMTKGKNLENTFDTPEMKAMIEIQQKRLHNAEVTVYNHISKLPEGKIPSTKIYYMRKFSESNPLKGYLIMEYLENLRPVHVFENVPAQTISKVLRAKAVLEAMSLKFSPEERSEFTEHMLSEVFGEMFKEHMAKDMFNIFRASAAESLIEKVNKVEEVYSKMMDLVWAENLSEELGMKRVLCHGDLWTTNMLWEQKGENVSIAALIDFQTAHMGCPAVDLVRLFSSCLSGKDRQEHWEELVEQFYGYLKEEVGDMELPYNLEQIKEAYRRYMPIGGFIMVITIGPFFDILGKTQDELQRKKVLDVVNEKTECLLDDMLYFHERNEKIKRGELVD